MTSMLNANSALAAASSPGRMLQPSHQCLSWQAHHTTYIVSVILPMRILADADSSQLSHLARLSPPELERPLHVQPVGPAERGDGLPDLLPHCFGSVIFTVALLAGCRSSSTFPPPCFSRSESPSSFLSRDWS